MCCSLVAASRKFRFYPDTAVKLLSVGTVLKIFFLTSLLSSNFLYAANITGLRLWVAPDHTRVVFDLDEKIDYKNFTLANPNRLVIDIDNAKLINSKVIKDLNWTETQVKDLRYSTRKKYLRVVFDLKKSINYKLFTLEPNSLIKHNRLVLDIYDKKEKVAETKSNLPIAISTEIKEHNKYRKFNIIVDAGHGGDDPGAIGPRGTREKDVVLKVAQYLSQYIDNDKSMRAYLTRTGDYYIGLRDRTSKARDSQADLFVSIHADGFHDHRARGASVFVLSERGASSELAKWIADHENASDLVGGVSLDNKDPMLASVLLDLSQTASNQSSYRVASNILDEMAKVTYMHKTRVEKAGFVVLKSPDIPSILVETGFISNPQGEKKLRTNAYQRKLAYSIYKGIKKYFETEPRPVRTNFDDAIIQAKNDK